MGSGLGVVLGNQYDLQNQSKDSLDPSSLQSNSLGFNFSFHQKKIDIDIPSTKQEAPLAQIRLKPYQNLYQKVKDDLQNSELGGESNSL